MRPLHPCILLPFILLCLSKASEGSMFQKQSRAAGEECCAQGPSPCNHGSINHGSRRNVDAVTYADQANAETAGVSLVTGSCATRWKRVVSPSNTSVGSTRAVGRSSILSNGVSPAEGTHFTPSCSLAVPSANITSSSTHESISTPTSVQPVSTVTTLSISTPSLFSTSIPQTPFTSTSTETLTSASPIGFTSGLSSSTSTDALPGTSATSFVTVITLSTVRPRPSPSFTMANPDTITLAPVYPTPTVIDSTYGPGTTQSASDTTLISSISSTPFVIPTFLSSTSFSPIPSTSDFPTPIASPYPSISAIPLSSISDDPTITSTSTLAGDQTITVVGTGTLSTDTPHDTGFAHQTGAVIGVGIAGTFVLLLIILLIFFACKRHRSNRSYNSAIEDISAVSRNTWHPPLEADDEHYLATYGHPVSPNYPNTSGNQSERGLFGDPLSIEGGSAEANGSWPVFGGQPLVPPLAQTRHRPRDPSLFPSHSSNDSHGSSRPWWGNTEPLSINKRSTSQQLPLTVNSHAIAIGSRSASSLGFGGSSSNGHLGPGSSGETLLPRGSGRTSTTEPRPIHRLNERRHYSTPPTAFMLGRDTSFEYSTQRIKEHQEEQNQQDRTDKSISKIILARLRASRRLSTATTVKAYSQCTIIGSEESAPSRTSSYIYSPSLLNPPISMSQTVPPLYLHRGVTGSKYTSDNTVNQYLPRRQRARDTSEGLGWPDVTIPPAPSPVPTDTSSMVEGLLDPRLLGMALTSSQQASAMSLRDHEDYTRPINGLVNNHIRSTTTFETQDTDTLDLGEGGA